MANYRLVSTLLILALFLTAGSLFISNSSKANQIAEAEVLGDALLDYFRLLGDRCRSDSNEFDDLTLCIDKQIAKLQVDIDVKEDDFKNARPERNETGYLILKNTGKKSMDSAGFILTKNHVAVDEGCLILGNIDPDYTCRIEFDSPCEPGDVLEVKYKDERAYIKTC